MAHKNKALYLEVRVICVKLEEVQGWKFTPQGRRVSVDTRYLFPLEGYHRERSHQCSRPTRRLNEMQTVQNTLMREMLSAKRVRLGCWRWPAGEKHASTDCISAIFFSVSIHRQLWRKVSLCAVASPMSKWHRKVFSVSNFVSPISRSLSTHFLYACSASSVSALTCLHKHWNETRTFCSRHSYVTHPLSSWP